MSVPSLDWNQHATIYVLGADRPKKMAAGALHAMVAVALQRRDDIDMMMIQTDSGAMFCRHEIEAIALEPDRPGTDHSSGL